MRLESEFIRRFTDERNDLNRESIGATTEYKLKDSANDESVKII